jgi:hypothetical protein
MAETKPAPEPAPDATPGLVTPVAPYSPDPNAAEGVDKAIARDGSGTHQTEPFGVDYPPEAKVEPAPSQVNTRNATCIGEPINPLLSAEHPDGSTSAILEGLKRVEESRLAAKKETEEDFKSRARFVAENTLGESAKGVAGGMTRQNPSSTASPGGASVNPSASKA